MYDFAISHNCGAKTPLHKLDDNLFLKCEFLHPGRSHKARVAKAMIDDAEKNNRIQPGITTILERTGGNLGIALAIEAKIRGYDIELVTDPNYSEIKKGIAARLGAKVIDRGLSYPSAENNGQVIDELLASPGEKKYHYLHQFSNPVNPLIHEIETGREIVDQLVNFGVHQDRTIALVKGLGTGASMQGIQKALRGYFSRVVTIGVQPEECDIQNNKYELHKIQGIAVGESPPFFDISSLDEVISVSLKQVLECQLNLLSATRFFVGLSSAANYHALTLASRRNMALDSEAVYVSLLYDRGEDYEKQ